MGLPTPDPRTRPHPSRRARDDSSSLNSGPRSKDISEERQSLPSEISLLDFHPLGTETGQESACLSPLEPRWGANPGALGRNSHSRLQSYSSSPLRYPLGRTSPRQLMASRSTNTDLRNSPHPRPTSETQPSRNQQSNWEPPRCRCFVWEAVAVGGKKEERQKGHTGKLLAELVIILVSGLAAQHPHPRMSFRERRKQEWGAGSRHVVVFRNHQTPAPPRLSSPEHTAVRTGGQQ